jgi:hypothetical protein
VEIGVKDCDQCKFFHNCADRALSALAEFDARKSQVVELRFFGGLSVEETAEASTFR